MLKEKEAVISDMKMQIAELERTVTELVKYKNSVTGTSLLVTKAINKAFLADNSPADESKCAQNPSITNSCSTVLNKDKEFLLRMHQMLQSSISKSVSLPHYLQRSLGVDPNSTTQFSSTNYNCTSDSNSSNIGNNVLAPLVVVPSQVAINRNLTILSLPTEETLAQLFDILALKQSKLASSQSKVNDPSLAPPSSCTPTSPAKSRKSHPDSTCSDFAPSDSLSKGLWIDLRLFLLFCLLSGVFSDDK